MRAAAARDAYVALRFDTLESRFKASVPADDPRLAALVRSLAPLEGRQVLDLGCGKGRFARRLREHGARVVGLDILGGDAGASGRDRAGAGHRVSAAAGVGGFDAVVAVEVPEHLEPLGVVLAEVRRVLRPGGRLAIVDKNAAALDARRPWLPCLAIKWLDQRRGRWMYPADGRCASDGSGRARCDGSWRGGSTTSKSSTCWRGPRPAGRCSGGCRGCG